MSTGIFGDEHAMLRRTIRAFVDKEVTPHVDAWEEAGRIPRAFWRRLGELGLLGLEFPVEYGGGGGDFLSSVVLGEEMARCRSGGVAFSVLVHTDMSSPWLTRYGTEAQKQQYLPGIVKGETVCALGITEPGTGSDMAALATRAVRQGDHYLLTGSKTFITNGVYGDLYFVAARTGDGSAERRHDGISMFLVERGLPGVLGEPEARQDGDARLRHRRARASRSARCPPRTCSASRAAGSSSSPPGSSASAIMAAVLALSGAAQALEDSASYLRERQAFGAPLAQKQVLRHRMADMATEIEAARQLVYRAASLYQAGEECVAVVSMAKLFATEAANRVAYQAVQMHGGYGYMRELPVERFFRDVRLWPIASGTSEMMREIIARRLLS